MAIAALVVGIVSLLLSFIPVINALAIIGALVALVLGIVAMRTLRSGLVSGRGMAIAGIVISALALVVAIAVNVAAVMAVRSLDASVDKAFEEQANDVGTPLSEDDRAAAADALSLGRSTEVGDYTVSVTAVDPDADDVIAAENAFNEEAVNQYVLVGVSVVYNGTQEGEPWLDLSLAYIGADGRQYDRDACGAAVPRSDLDVPPLRSTGAADFNVCMDVPAEAIAGGTVVVEEYFTFGDTRAYWAAP